MKYLILLALLPSLVLAAPAQPKVVTTINWGEVTTYNDKTPANIAGYFIYRTSGTGYLKATLNPITGNKKLISELSLPDGSYEIFMTAIDVGDIESGASNKIAFDVVNGIAQVNPRVPMAPGIWLE